jgi:uncharacterized RDD family membrane protein YckC
MDGVLLFVAYSLAAWAVLALTGTSPESENEKQRMTAALLTGMLQLAYFAGSWIAWRGTLGQRIMGLMVVRENGDRLPALDALARWAALQGPLALSMALPEGWVFLGTLGAAFWTSLLLVSVRSDPLGRGLHDRIAGSRAILAV